MPLFAGRVAALSPKYSVPLLAYFDPNEANPSLTFLDVSSLSNLKLSYNAKAPLKGYTLWEFAARNANSFVMPSLGTVKRKIGGALELAVREDEEFWARLQETEDEIIIFNDPHWLWGRYRPTNDMYWSGRNELGELLMLVRESYRTSLARFMPLQPFPLSSNTASSTDVSTLAFEGVSALPFIPNSTAFPEAFSANSRSRPRAPRLLLPARTTSVSTSGIPPPPPYTSNPVSPVGDMAIDPRLSGRPVRISRRTSPERLDEPSLTRDQCNFETVAQQAQGLPRRLRLLPVNEDSELLAINRLREEYRRDRSRTRNVSDCDIAVLRSAIARRLNRQEMIDSRRRLRETERERANAEAIIARRGVYESQSGSDSSSKIATPPALQRANELGALRAGEIEGRILGHREAMRHLQDVKRERQLGQLGQADAA